MTKHKGKQRVSTSAWGQAVNDKDRLIKQAEYTLALHRRNRAAAERNGRCSYTQPHGGWRCTADNASIHVHRYNEHELPFGWKVGD